MIDNLANSVGVFIGRYESWLIVGGGVFLAVSFILSFYLLFSNIKSSNDPAFHYLPDEGNGEVLPVCDGDSQVKVRIVGSRDVPIDTPPSDSISIVLMAVTNQETGEVIKAEPKMSLSDGSVIGKVDFVNVAELPFGLEAGRYNYHHAFFTVSETEGASNVASFSTDFEVAPCLP